MLTAIEVTAEDIAQGKPNCHDSCPIALATQRTTGLPIFVGEVWMYREDIAWEIALPPEAEAFVRDFDDGEPVEPFSFAVNLALAGATTEAP